MASSKIMSFYQPNQLEQRKHEKWILGYVSACLVGRKTYCTNSILCEDRQKYTLQVWRWHIKTLTIWYKLQLCLVWQFWQKGTILTVKARQWSVLGPKEINFVHTQKPFTSVTILATTFTCCHDILMLMTVYALIFSGEARSAVPSRPPSLLLLSRLPLINTIESRVLTINLDMQLLITHNKIVRIWDAVSTVRCFSNQQYQRRLRDQHLPCLAPHLLQRL